MSRTISAALPRALSKQDLAMLMKAGMTYRESHRFQQARQIFSAIRTVCPTEANAEIGLGSTCFSEGRFDAAGVHYREALKLNPCNAYAYALLGESQMFLGEYSAAHASFHRARKLDPNGPYGLLADKLSRFMESLPDRSI